MRIHILTAVWQRPQVTRICFEGIKRLRNYKPGTYHIEATAVCSENGAHRDLCETYGVDYVHTSNRPLGHKWHTGLQRVLKSDFDYLMILGSDDIVSNSLLDIYNPLFEEEYYSFGVRDLYVYSASYRQMKYFPGYPNHDMSIGAGRMIHREVIERCGNKLWKFTKNRGLDGSALERMRAFGFDEQVITAKGKAVVLDIKGTVNLNRFEHFDGEQVDKEEVFTYFSETETGMINQLK